MLRKGDQVVMHSCAEAEYYKGKIWTCQSDEQKLHPDYDYTVVWLEGYGRTFIANFLQRVDVSAYVQTKEIEHAKAFSEGVAWSIKTLQNAHVLAGQSQEKKEGEE